MTNSEPMYLVADTETSGISVFTDQVVQLVIATVDGDGNVINFWEWFIKPRATIPEAASNVHKLTTEWLEENGRDPVEVYKEAIEVFADHFDLTWVMYNMSFDMSILDTEFRRYGVFPNFGQVASENVALYDPLVWVREKDGKQKNKLIDVAKRYELEFDADALHDARADVELTAKVAITASAMYGFPTPHAQKEAHEKWTKDFRHKLHSWGKTIEPGDLTGEWPYMIDPFGE